MVDTVKILYHHRTASRTGEFVHIEELIAALRRLGHEVIEVGPKAAPSAALGATKGSVALMKRLLPRFFYELLEFSYSFWAFFRLFAAWRKHRPDILYERYNLFCPAGVWLRRLVGLPMLLEVNAPLLEERSQYGGVALPKLAGWSERTTWRGANRVLPVTEVLAATVRRAGVAGDRITVIPNGINRQRFDRPVDRDGVRRRLGVSEALVLGFTGFLREWHGLEAAIEVLARSGNGRLVLVLVGDGPHRLELEANAQRLGVRDRVIVTGFVERDAIADHVAAFDIALQPAVIAHASPLKLFEYLALARPVVAPKTANIEEIVTDGVSALLFPPGDDAAFAERIDRLCRDEALRHRIGEAGRRLIEERDLTWDGNARRITALAEVLLGVSGHGSGLLLSDEEAATS
ncbi:MAG: glycosyltransferase family 4 protein [Defluviicoccus sp.]